MDENQEDNPNNLISETNELLNSLKSSLVDSVLASKQLLEHFKNNELNTESGISLFDLRNRTFLAYLIDLADIMRKKLIGEPNDSTLERLVEERIILERIRPIEDKLKYQVDIMMKQLNTNKISNNPLECKPDFSFAIDSDDGDGINQNTDKEKKNIIEEFDTSHIDKQKSSQIYVPPRLAQMKYEDEQEKRTKNLERAKKRMLSSSIISELRREFDDAPEEEFDGAVNQKSRIGKFLKKKKKYEEENFIRLTLTKKQKKQARKLSSHSNQKFQFTDI